MRRIFRRDTLLGIPCHLSQRIGKRFMNQRSIFLSLVTYVIAALSVVIVAFHWSGLLVANAADPTGQAQPVLANQSARDADEKAFRATADQFVKAFNAGDAKTIGAQWSIDASYTDESGKVLHGRDAIQ